MKSYFIVFVVLITITNVTAFFPRTHVEEGRKYWSEAYEENVIAVTDMTAQLPKNFLCTTFGIFCPDVRTKVFGYIESCNKEDPRNYKCMPNMNRMCYRSCQKAGLEYNSVEGGLFEEYRCYCNELNSSIQIKVGFSK